MRFRLARIGAFALIVGAVACSSDGTSTTDLPTVGPDGSLPINQPFQLQIGIHCGVGRIGVLLNDRNWTTDEARDERDWMPAEWAATVDKGDYLVIATVELADEGDRLIATVADRSVTYRPTTADDPTVFCE